jgi:ATP-dependent DNA helicase RecG
LKFQETEEGNLIQLLQEVPKQLGHKFLIKNISFEGLLRIEKGEYPAASFARNAIECLGSPELSGGHDPDKKSMRIN